MSAQPESERNILWLVFTQSDWRVTIVDWYDVPYRAIAFPETRPAVPTLDP